ncbi:MAG: NosD domain-containing protein [Candidatus Sulfotelmatobacter sp.]
MRPVRFPLAVSFGCIALFVLFSQAAVAKTICVNTSGSNGCYSTIQSAVSAASKYDVINVWPGTYKEDVVVSKPMSLLGAGAGKSIIDASNLANGILLDGYDNPGLDDITVAGFTVKNALYEGVLVLNTSDAVIRDNHIINNDTIGPVFGSGPACNGQPAYETDESGDCGGGLHLLGAVGAVVSGNVLTGNADGVLISDDSGQSRDNLIFRNIITDNPEECGVVLASHPPVGAMPPAFAPHYGVIHNTVSENVVARNGVKVGGAGAGLFSDGEGQGRTSGNVIIRNELTGNGIPGVSLHTHVGPNFGLPADDMSGNMIIGNYIAGNGADTDDTATPGTAGININSGGGGSPVYGMIISQNIIRNEDIAIAFNVPNEIDAHLNDLENGKVGVANVCAFDNAACTGANDVTQNFWGCAAGPNASGCATTSGTRIRATPSLSMAVAGDKD